MQDQTRVVESNLKAQANEAKRRRQKAKSLEHAKQVVHWLPRFLGCGVLMFGAAILFSYLVIDGGQTPDTPM
jgi:hypothetical protein